MGVMKWLKYVFLKIVTLGKIDIKKEEKRKSELAKVLVCLHRTSVKDWILERSARVVKKRIYHEVHVGDDLIFDGICGVVYVPRYEIDNTKEPIKIYETWPYFFVLDRDKGFMAFHSGDHDVFCKGTIMAIINSDIIIEDIVRGKTDVDSDLLGFFDELRMHFRKRQEKDGR